MKRLFTSVSAMLVLWGTTVMSQPGSQPRYLVEVKRPQSQGLVAAYADLRIDKMVRVMSALAPSPAPGELGGPREGMDWRSLLDFFDGKLAFARRFTAQQGLGPYFNDVSCANCHRAPVDGGGGRDMNDGIIIHGPPETNGDAMGKRKHAVAGYQKESAHGKTGRLRTPPLFGLGLLDAVDDAVIDANLDPGDSNGDGIVGVRAKRYGARGVVRPSRFGQKANEWNLRRFVAGALFDEMGVTSTARRQPVADDDKVADPEVPVAFIDRLDAYVRNLARPARGPITKAVLAGEKLFHKLGCVGCHRPQLGSLKGAYSDLLLHDMGPLLDNGLKDGFATGRHWRTMPLWGIRFRARYLHDERAGSYDEVLSFHKGEALKPATAYLALPAASRRLIGAFLDSL